MLKFLFWHKIVKLRTQKKPQKNSVTFPTKSRWNTDFTWKKNVTSKSKVSKIVIWTILGTLNVNFWKFYTFVRFESAKKIKLELTHSVHSVVIS